MPFPAEAPRAERSIGRPVLIAVAVQLVLMVAVTTIKLRTGRDDADIHFRHAALIREGKVPYRVFPVDDPPMVLPLFLATALRSGLVGSAHR